MATKAPEDVYAFYMAGKVPASEPFPKAIHGEKVCGLMWCYTGPEDEAEAAVQGARDIAEPLFEHIGPLPYPMLQSLFDKFDPPGYQWYWEGDFVRQIPGAAIAEHVRFGKVPTSLSTMHLYPINGAVHRVGQDGAAWNYRDANWSMVITGIDPNPSNEEKISEWARDYWQSLHRHSTGASYVNFMMEEGTDRIRASYGDNYEDLRRIKAKYDPDNFFHINQNIEPATAT